MEIKAAMLNEQKQLLKECKNCHVEFVPKDENQELCYLCSAPETVGIEQKKATETLNSISKTRLM